MIAYLVDRASEVSAAVVVTVLVAVVSEVLAPATRKA